MATILKHMSLFLMVTVSLFLILTFSCEQKERHAGIYVAHKGELPESSEAYIELKDNGQGIWRVLDDEASFNWSVNDDEIRLHTKSGGIIIGKIKNDILEISLPGRNIRYFRSHHE